MYRINDLYRNVLIVPDEVIFHAPTKQTIDIRMIRQSIIVAEERFVRPSLGFEFYQSLVDAKNREVTEGNKETLQAAINASLQPGSQEVVLNVGDIVNSESYLSPADKKLWREHLWKLTAEAVIMLALPEGFVQFSSEGAIHQQPPAGPINNTPVVSPELRSMKWIMDKKLMDRIDPLRASMHLWLCLKRKADKSTYPLYKEKCACDEDGISVARKSDIILGIYDQEEDCAC